MSEEVLISRDNGVMTITMNRPEAKNAMNKNMSELIAAALDELDASNELRVAVITGAGGTFCSGMDLKGFLAGETPSVKGRGFGGLTEAPPAKPLIAAIEGYALAGGFELAIACDLIVAASTSKFGVPEVKRSLVAGAGGLIRLPDQVAPRIAMELALTGDFITAQRAYEINLINQVVDEGKALEGALDLAARIAANGPLAVAASKKIIQEYASWPHDQRWAEQGKIMGPVFTSEDAREGATAFAEKRAPVWKGK
jgi:enoyl-CoA hydratase